jgi:glyoxylase-like metal-dependent hydrolase (beta-lactamase superfamily II)
VVSGLGFAVYVAAPKHAVSDDPPPGESKRMWSPTASTLIFGGRDAILVDPLMTIDESRLLTEWAASYGRRVTTIFVTHAHGDHFFGAPAVLKRFPKARLLAAPSVVERMPAQWGPQWFDNFWSPNFPDQIVRERVIAEPLADNMFELDGEVLRVVELGHTDTPATTALHVPSIGLVVAGDAVYGDVHLNLGEATDGRTDEWFAALDSIDLLEPEAVIAGHKLEGDIDNPAQIDWTRCYLRDFLATAERAATCLDLYSAMVELYPDRVDRGALWNSARAFLP